MHWRLRAFENFVELCRERQPLVRQHPKLDQALLALRRSQLDRQRRKSLVEFGQRRRQLLGLALSRHEFSFALVEFASRRCFAWAISSQAVASAASIAGRLLRQG